MNVALAKTETGRAVNELSPPRATGCPARARSPTSRRQAFEAFERAGLPHRRIEEWKYTDLRALMREVLPLAPAPDAAALKRARAALKPIAVDGATQAGAGGRRVRAGAVGSRRSGGRQRRRRCAKCWRGGDAAPICWQTDVDRRDDLAECGDGDRRRRDLGIADGAALVQPDPDHSCRDRVVGVGLHAFACDDRQGRARHAGRELCRGRRREGLSGQ